MKRSVRNVSTVAKIERGNESDGYVTATIFKKFIDKKTRMVVYCADEIRGTLVDVGKILIHEGNIDLRLI